MNAGLGAALLTTSAALARSPGVPASHSKPNAMGGGVLARRATSTGTSAGKPRRDATSSPPGTSRSPVANAGVASREAASSSAELQGRGVARAIPPTCMRGPVARKHSLGADFGEAEARQHLLGPRRTGLRSKEVDVHVGARIVLVVEPA